MMDEPPEKWAYKSKTAAELEQLAWDIVAGQVFGTWVKGCDPTMSFMVLALLNQEQMVELQQAEIVHVYEYISEAGPRSVNGMPCFFSMRHLDRHDWSLLVPRVKELLELKAKRLEEAK